MAAEVKKLSVTEKVGYSLGDAAANFVFMTMILYQANFYTDVMGIAAGTAAIILLAARLWDAFFDPVMGALADRTRTRWGRFRPWILITALPWGIVMYLAYATPAGWSMNSIVAYAVLTNVLLMTLYSANNMPYSALGGVMTGDAYERTSLNAYRFVAANLAQLIVAGFTLPLVAKFAATYGDGVTARATGWQITMGMWAVVCVVFFLITFATTRERVEATVEHNSSLKQDFVDLLANRPWLVMFVMTLIHFTILSLRGGAFYNYYHYYADKAAMYDWLEKLHLTSGPIADGMKPGGILEFLGWIVHADRSNLANSNVADVAQSVINVIEKIVFIIMILMSPMMTKAFGKKAIAVVGFALTTIVAGMFYFIEPNQIDWMVALTVIVAITYGPTIPVLWAMFADVADYGEWTTGRRTTGIIFATIGFALKAGLSLGAFVLLMLLSRYGYSANQDQAPDALYGIRMVSSIYPAAMFAVCTVLLMLYQINKRQTLKIAADLAGRREIQAAH
ncbi:MAG TPA: MFS transporter [Lacipirellulaceae bacterium]|jgi:Na+/melibiose symporter-like transporter